MTSAITHSIEAMLFSSHARIIACFLAGFLLLPSLVAQAPPTPPLIWQGPEAAAENLIDGLMGADPNDPEGLPDVLSDEAFRIMTLLWAQREYREDLQRFAVTTAGGNSIPKIILWLRADAITPADVTSGKVTRWPDQSGGDHHATTPIAGREPTYIASGPNSPNGKPSVRFDESIGQFMDASLSASPGTHSFTALVVFRSKAVGIDSILSTLVNPTDTSPGLLFVRDLSANALYKTPRTGSYYYGQSLIAADASYIKETWTFATLVYHADYGTLILYQEGQPVGGVVFPGRNVTGYDSSATLGDNPLNLVWRLGNNPALNGGLSGEIAEVLLYQGALAPQFREAQENYLADKYGIARPRRRLLFSDHFNISDNADANADLALRQSGVLAPTSFRHEQGDGAHPRVFVRNGMLRSYSGQEFDANRDWIVGPRVDFKAFEKNRSFRIRATLLPSAGLSPATDDPFEPVQDAIELTGQDVEKPDAPFVQDDSWAALKFRSNKPVDSFSSSQGAGIKIEPNGEYQIYDRRTKIAKAGDTSNPISSAPAYQVEVNVINNFARYTINGVRIRQKAADGTFTGSDLFPISDVEGNIISLVSYTRENSLPLYSQFDDLEVWVEEGTDPIPSGSLVLLDNFDSPNAIDINQDLSRQTGERRPIAYQTLVRGGQGKARISDNALALEAVSNSEQPGEVMVSPQINFGPLETDESFVVSVSIRPPVGTGDRWAGIKFRNEAPLEKIQDGSGFGFSIRSSGMIQLFNGTEMLTARSVTPAAEYRVDFVVVNNQLKTLVNGDPVLFVNSAGIRTGVLTLPLKTANYCTLYSFVPAGSSPGISVFENLSVQVPGVIPAIPFLSITPLPDGNLKISWPMSAGEFLLQASEDLGAPNSWNAAGLSINVEGADRYVIETPTATQRFFRLIQ